MWIAYYSKNLSSEKFTRWLQCKWAQCHQWVWGHEQNVFQSQTHVSSKCSNKLYYSKLGLSVPTTSGYSHHSSCIHTRVTFVGSCHLLKFWGKKPKATTKVTLRATNHYRLQMKLQEGNVFTVSHSVHRVMEVGVSHASWDRYMIGYSLPWTSGLRNYSLLSDIRIGTLPPPPDIRAHPTDTWQSSLKTCSNVFIWEPTPPVLTSSAGHRNMYGWQAGSTHPTGMLSCSMVQPLGVLLLLQWW